MAGFVTVNISGDLNIVDLLFDDEDQKTTGDMGADLIAATAVDTGALRNAWDIDITNCTITNPMPYAHKIMQGGHSKQTPPGTFDAIVDKYSR